MTSIYNTGMTPPGVHDKPLPSAAGTERQNPGVKTEKRSPGRAGLVADIALPLIAYYTVRGLGSSTWAALLAATAAGGIRLIAVALWTRQFSWFSAIMLMFFGVGLAVAFIGGDPRFLLLKDSFSTGLLGAMFLFSLVTRRPLALAAAEAARPSHAADLDHLYRAGRPGRRAFRTSTLVWGLGLLSEALVRVPLVYMLPVDLMVGLSTAMMIGCMAALAGWNVVYVVQAARRYAELRILLPGNPRS